MPVSAFSFAYVPVKEGTPTTKQFIVDTTTNPTLQFDLIDQNIMYAKIFLKPARAIEFIAVDFFITKTGASFPV